ncbi:MAG: OmpA family protein, partial [Myxococcota bacterium]
GVASAGADEGSPRAEPVAEDEHPATGESRATPCPEAADPEAPGAPCPDTPEAARRRTDELLQQVVLFRAVHHRVFGGDVVALAQALLADDRALEVVVVGHASPREQGRRVAQRRAAAVVGVLVEHGVPRERLRFAGARDLCPVEDITDWRSNDPNRRVEFRVTAVDGTPTGTSLACPAARDVARPLPAPRLPTPTPEDGDGDGIADAVDACPALPESIDGEADDDGCPEPGDAVIVDFAVKLIDAAIRFETDSAQIQRPSFPHLDALAEVFARHPEIRLAEVEGHDAWHPDPEWSSGPVISRDRAQSVVESLVQRGVERERLRGAGYGSRCLLDTRPSRRAYRRNLRVELKILVTTDGPTGVSVGCPGAEDLIEPIP